MLFKNYSDETLAFSQPTLIGDMRTQMVQRGDYRTMHKGYVYYMTPFVGLVTDIRIMDNNPKRARLVIELQDGKKLAFFADINEYIKEGSIIEAVGICVKEDTGFYNFICRGGVKRIFTPEEIYQHSKGVKLIDTQITRVPWDIISSIRESDKINKKSRVI